MTAVSSSPEGLDNTGLSEAQISILLANGGYDGIHAIAAQLKLELQANGIVPISDAVPHTVNLSSISVNSGSDRDSVRNHGLETADIKMGDVLREAKKDGYAVPSYWVATTDKDPNGEKRSASIIAPEALRAFGSRISESVGF